MPSFICSKAPPVRHELLVLLEDLISLLIWAVMASYHLVFVLVTSIQAVKLDPYEAAMMDEETIAKQRVEEAEDAQQHKSLGEKIVNISAVPGGYKASSEEDKTLTSALVSLLEATEKGIPLGELKERLRKEQKKQKSRNFPDVKGSLSFRLVQGIFPV